MKVIEKHSENFHSSELQQLVSTLCVSAKASEAEAGGLTATLLAIRYSS